MRGTLRRLGDAAGAKGVGVNRLHIKPGMLSTPPHSHGRSEEIFFVLGGSGLLWQDEEVCEVRACDTIVHVADREEHTLRAGAGGLDVLIFGTRHPVEYGWLPRSRALRLGYVWAEGCGSVQSGLKWSRREANAELAIPHCHSAEEEAFVVLEGNGTLELWPSPRMAMYGAQRETHPIRAGDVVARPPGTRVAHFIRAGANGMTCLVYGTREPNDICYYPRSNKIGFRGVGVLGRIESLDYWDGEPPPE